MVIDLDRYQLFLFAPILKKYKSGIFAAQFELHAILHFQNETI